MSTKITLISPPDIYQNNNYSLLLIDIDEKEQESISSWLGRNITKESLNVYYYQGEPNVPWLLHALSCADSKYINLNNTSAVYNIRIFCGGTMQQYSHFALYGIKV